MNMWKIKNCALVVLAIALSGMTSVGTKGNMNSVSEQYAKEEYMIQMRDGARLYTQVYMPKDISRKYGMIFERTAYGVGSYGATEFKEVLGPNPYYARAGFIFVYQDIRGTFMSEGEFSVIRPFHPDKEGPSDVDESSDAYDTIEWLLANIPNHNGKVVMWGTSYSGWLAVMGILDPHPALVAVFPQAPPIDMWRGDDFHHNGAFRLMYAFAWTSSHARAREKPTRKCHPPFDYGTPDGYRFFLKLGPLKNADSLYFRGSVPTWNEFMRHGDYDDYWLSRNALSHLKRLDIPVLIVGGWFDGEDFYGPMKLYRAIEEKIPNNDCRLVVGPWRHSGWNWMDGDELGEMRFGSFTGRYFRENIEFPFFAHHLAGEGSLELPEVLMFETGANEWRTFDAWPPSGTMAKSLFFREKGGLDMNPPDTPSASSRDSFESNPDKPVPWSTEIRPSQGHQGMYEDQRFAASRPDVLVYESEILTRDVTIAGPVKATLYATTTGTDADWIVKLIDVYPDDSTDHSTNPCGTRMGGYQLLLTADVFRSKYRNSIETPEPLLPGSVTEIRFDLPDRLHCFLKGHRIMVQVQSTWFPVVDRNPQTFVDIYHADEIHYQKAIHSIYRTPQHPSHITIQVYEK